MTQLAINGQDHSPKLIQKNIINNFTILYDSNKPLLNYFTIRLIQSLIV